MKHVYLVHEGGNEKRKQKKVKFNRKGDFMNNSNVTRDASDLRALWGVDHSQQHEPACEFKSKV